MVGDFSLGSRSFLQVDTDGVVGVDCGCTIGGRVAALGDVDFTWAANPGKGSDMGSVLRSSCEDNLTGSWLRCSGRSSQRGVPGRLPSETSSAPATRLTKGGSASCLS